MQQRLGRDAAAIKADAAGVRFRIDQRNFHAQVGSQKCGGISAGTAANYCHTKIRSVRHNLLMSLFIGPRTRRRGQPSVVWANKVVQNKCAAE